MFKIVVLITLLTSEGPPDRSSLISSASFASMQLCEVQLEKDRPGMIEDVTKYFVEAGMSADRVKVDMKCVLQQHDKPEAK